MHWLACALFGACGACVTVALWDGTTRPCLQLAIEEMHGGTNPRLAINVVLTEGLRLVHNLHKKASSGTEDADFAAYSLKTLKEAIDR